MDLYLMYKYAYWGAIEELKTLTKLYNMCLEVSDGDAAEEYENCRLVILPDDNHGYDLHLDRVLDEIKTFLKDSQ